MNADHATRLWVWVIYDHPKDYPHHFVVRAQIIIDGQTIHGSPRLFATLGHARKYGIPPGLVCFQRAPEDDPVIVESWL